MVTAEPIGLMRSVLGPSPFLEIDTATANALAAAMDDITGMIDVEQKFDILLENFIEFEQELFSRTLRQAYRLEPNSTDIFDDTLALNRRTINVLTAARLYADQAKHHVSVFFPGDTAKADELRKYFSAEYDAHLSYRVMEALRNYTQHRGLPLQGLTHHLRWVNQATADRALEFNISPNIFVAELERDQKFKAATLTELKGLGDIIDLKVMTREYVEALGRVHDEFRSLLQNRIEGARGLMLTWIQKYKALCGDGPHSVDGLAVCRRHPNGTADHLSWVTADSLDYLGILRARNSQLGRLSRRFITTRAQNETR